MSIACIRKGQISCNSKDQSMICMAGLLSAEADDSFYQLENWLPTTKKEILKLKRAVLSILYIPDKLNITSYTHWHLNFGYWDTTFDMIAV